MTARRVIAGTLLAILLSGTAMWLGPEPEKFWESIGSMALLGGPVFLVLGILLARGGVKGPGLVFLGMALSVLALLGILLVLTPVLRWWAFVFFMYFFLPALAGGAGLGLGLWIGGRT
jgi:hypothetical protein